MPENRLFLPEGLSPRPVLTLHTLRSALENGTVLEAVVRRCDAEHTLHIPLGPASGILSRSEAIAPWISGAERDISVLSKVGKQICFTVKSIHSDAKGTPVALLSRRDVQEKAWDYLSERLRPGSVITGVVTHLASFGAFVDIGCGIVAMLPIEHISVSRISHPRDRFAVGQKILAVIHSMDPERRRFTLSHRELLGTWMENASWFHAGDTVQGVVRSVKDYGSFVELTPNLSGLMDAKDGLQAGDRVSVYIKSIHPDRAKIKLQLIERLPLSTELEPPRYQITDGVLERWVYLPADCQRPAVETDFTEASP